MRGGMRGTGLSPEVTKRVVVYGLLLLLLGSAQVSFFARVVWLPAIPDLLLGTVVALSLLESERVAVVAAIGGGFLIDALGSVGVSLSPILYLIVALAICPLAAKMLPRFLSWALLMLPALVLRMAYGALRLLLTAGRGALPEALKQILLPELLTTLLLCVPLYFLLALLSRLLRGRRERDMR